MLLALVLSAGLQVHEWGVIQQNPVLTGAPYAETPAAEAPVSELEDRAPVVYFHGDPCVVSMRITFPNMGYATEAIPEPGEGGVNSTYLAWENLELTDQRPVSADFGWPACGESSIPAPVWRDVEALDILFGGQRDSFLYYECVPGSPGDLPYISLSGNQALRMPYGEIPCIVLVSSSGGPMYGVFTLAEIITSIPKGLQFLEDPASLRREVWRWADGVINEDEFAAFWNTWESSFLEDCTGDVMVLYPVPEEVLERIAPIEIITEEDMETEISRFILAELPYRNR